MQTELVPLPQSHANHPLFDSAWEVLHGMGIRRDGHLVSIHDPRWEDACSEVVVALLEKRDPVEAAREVLATEKRHSARSIALQHVEHMALAG
jgi:hypothetical protein